MADTMMVEFLTYCDPKDGRETPKPRPVYRAGTFAELSVPSAMFWISRGMAKEVKAPAAAPVSGAGKPGKQSGKTSAASQDTEKIEKATEAVEEAVTALDEAEKESSSEFASAQESYREKGLSGVGE